MITELRGRARAASRRAELAARQRAGTYSRRQIRQRRREVLRQHWRHFGTLLLIGAAAALAAAFVLPDSIADYAFGAIAVATLWLGTTAMHWMDGMANHRLGLAGEELTADELQKLRKRGWRVVHHVMLEKSDIDHAVLGPGGFFAVDSKYRTDWSSARDGIGELARRSHRQAAALQSRLRVREPKVQPAVVLWGPRVSKVFDEVFEHDGVTFCLGAAFVDHVAAIEPSVDQKTIDLAYDQLDDYVTRRDVGEARDHGAPARPVLEHVQDLLIAAFLALVTLVAIVVVIRFPPVGVWAIALATAIGFASFHVRSRFPESDRAQRATAATGAASVGSGLLVAGLLLVDIVW